jgi:hypothetical protein
MSCSPFGLRRARFAASRFRVLARARAEYPDSSHLDLIYSGYAKDGLLSRNASGTNNSFPP